MDSYIPAPDPKGRIITERKTSKLLEVYFIPDNERLTSVKIDPLDGEKHRVRILVVNSKEKTITIEPRNTRFADSNFLEPKYPQIRQIQIDIPNLFQWWRYEELPDTRDDILELLSSFPPAFTKDPDYGLGLAKDYRFIVEKVEELSDCTTLVVTSSGETRIDGSNFYISQSHFESLRRSINNITNLGRSASVSVKTATVHNLLAEKIDRPTVEVNFGRHPYRRLITVEAASEMVLGDKEQDAILEMMTRSAKIFARAKPQKLAKMRSQIEFVTMDVLIERFEEMLGKKLKEAIWQKFINENSFIVNMTFGHPVILVKQQASVGGWKLSGDGNKIADFLVKNSLTNNTAILEIKTPQTKIVSKNPVRGGVYAPSSEISGSINQVLDQKYQFQKNIAQLKEGSRLYNIESYAVHSCLIIGLTPDSDDKKKSFELFRNNSKEVEIFTFDEVLEKIKQLHSFLKEANTKSS